MTYVQEIEATVCKNYLRPLPLKSPEVGGKLVVIEDDLFLHDGWRPSPGSIFTVGATLASNVTAASTTSFGSIRFMQR